MNNCVAYFPISNTHGYAVDHYDDRFHVVYAKKFTRTNEKGEQEEAVDTVADARSMGRVRIYGNLNLARQVIEIELLPLYKKGSNTMPKGAG